MIDMSRVPDPTSDARSLRDTVHDLVTLSVTPVWWVGKSVAVIAETLGDVLLSMLKPDGVYLSLPQPVAGPSLTVVRGPAGPEVEAAVEARPTRDGEHGWERSGPQGADHSVRAGWTQRGRWPDRSLQHPPGVPGRTRGDGPTGPGQPSDHRHLSGRSLGEP